MAAVFIIIIVLLIFIFATVGIFNTLVRLRNQVINNWSQIDVQLKRRHDLIPNLVKTAKGYMKHERETLDDVVRARSQAVKNRGIGNQAIAEKALSRALGKLFVVVENYPDLKASQNFLVVQEELTSTERMIASARKDYNNQVLFLNNRIQMFPSNLVASFFRFKEQEFFELEEQEAKETPKIEF